MTTNLSTSNLNVPDAEELTRLANAYFAALPGNVGSFLNTSTADRANPLKSADLPNGEDLRKIPAGLAGVSSQTPQQFTGTTSGDEASTLGFYFLKAVEPTTPGVIPLVRPDLRTLDPSIGTTGTNAYSAARPHGNAGNQSIPGSQHGSLPIHTPGIEAGSLPATAAYPPLSAFSPPNDGALRSSPGLADGTSGHQAASYVNSKEGLTGIPYYVDIEEAAFRRHFPTITLEPRTAEIEILPDLGLPFTNNSQFHHAIAKNGEN